MLNGKILREGDITDGAEILAIEEREVRIRLGSDERTLRVGSTIVPGQSARPAMHIVRNTGQIQSAPEQARPITDQPDPVPALAGTDSPERVYKVRQGETISGIAETYLSGSVTRNQIVVALYEANPQAFSGNINTLRAGATLRIPDKHDMQRQSPGTATAEVVAQTDAWRNGSAQPARLADVATERQYGPVNYGETLSGIAERTLSEGVTMDQMMIALFEANPQAFDGNINALHEGAILRIPDDRELMRRPRRTASAEVVAQTVAWGNRSVQQARSEDVLSQVTASTFTSSHLLVPPFE